MKENTIANCLRTAHKSFYLEEINKIEKELKDPKCILKEYKEGILFAFKLALESMEVEDNFREDENEDW